MPAYSGYRYIYLAIANSISYPGINGEFSGGIGNYYDFYTFSRHRERRCFFRRDHPGRPAGRAGAAGLWTLVVCGSKLTIRSPRGLAQRSIALAAGGCCCVGVGVVGG